MSIASRPAHAEEFERAFEKLHETSQRVKFDIKCTEAQHNRPFLLQRWTEEQRKGNGHQLLSMLDEHSRWDWPRATRYQ